MKRITDFLKVWGIAPVYFYAALLLLIVIVFAVLFYSCDDNEPVIAPIDQTKIDELNSKNAERRTAAADKIINEVDAERKISDEQRAEIKREVERSSRIGKNVSAEDFRRLLEEKSEQ